MLVKFCTLDLIVSSIELIGNYRPVVEARAVLYGVKFCKEYWKRKLYLFAVMDTNNFKEVYAYECVSAIRIIPHRLYMQPIVHDVFYQFPL